MARLHPHKDNWSPGETAYFEYHCFQSHASGDAELWYRSQQPVTVVADEGWDGPADLDTLAKRAQEGVPRVYRVRFADGLEHTAFEDELLTSAEFYDPMYRPGQRPRKESR